MREDHHDDRPDGGSLDFPIWIPSPGPPSMVADAHNHLEIPSPNIPVIVKSQPPSRRPKGPIGRPRVPDEIWEPLKGEVYYLYYKTNMLVRDIPKTLEESNLNDPNFHPCLSSLRHKMSEWGFEKKNVVRKKMQVMAAKSEKRMITEGKKTVIVHHGVQTRGEEMEFWKNGAPTQALIRDKDSGLLAGFVATPPGITYYTPVSSPRAVPPIADIEDFGVDPSPATLFHVLDKYGNTEALDMPEDEFVPTPIKDLDEECWEERYRRSFARSPGAHSFNEPSPTVAPATDSGYASIGGDNKSKSLNNEDDDDTCTIMTENHPLDIETEVRDKLSGTLAEELFRSLEPTLHRHSHACKTIKKEAIRRLLKDFSIKLRCVAKLGQEHDATVFVRQQRSRIAALLDKSFHSLSCGQDEAVEDVESTQSFEKIDWKDKIANWDVIGADTLGRVPADVVPSAPEDVIDDEDYSISQFSKAKIFLLESVAYRNLVEGLTAELLLSSRDETIINDVRNTVLDGLEKNPKKNGYNISSCVVQFEMLWTPISFLKGQFPDVPTPKIGNILVYTGSEFDAQVSTCEQYIRQTWGAAGVEVLRALEEVIHREQIGVKFKIWLADASWLEVELSVNIIVVVTSGPAPTVADIGELLAWIGAAGRESSHPNEIGISIPRITRQITSRPTFTIDATIESIDSKSNGQESRPNGTCWHYMLRNPVVVKGYPIPRREHGERGLEIQLPLMAALGNAERATVFDEGLVIKGHSTMFVPTKQEEQSVLWHFLFHEDETRMSYLEAAKYCQSRVPLEELDASHLETSRNFVGWSSSVYLQTGTRSENIKYDKIRWTGSNYASPGCAFEKVSISAGKIMSAGVTFARGIKDTPLYLNRAMAYEQEIHDAGNMYVVLYDIADKRAWLVDGANALLHLTCTQLATVWSQKSRLFNLEDFHYADVNNGPTAAASALLDPDNRKMAIFEEVETWKEVTTTVGNAATTLNSAIKEEHKEKKTQWCYEDLVRQLYHVLELMHDYQVKILTSSVTGLRFTDRDKLEGFALMDIVDGPSAILPRVAILKPSGKGWVDFTKSICAITLMARGFGELIKSNSHSNVLCREWQSVPTGRDYLVACISTLSKICERQGDPDAIPMELAQGIFWHKAHMMFESCKCGKSTQDSTCDRVQVLLPPSLGRKRHPQPFGELLGAVIFGRSKRYTWSWPKRGNPTEGVADDEEDDDEIAHDSGLGSSLQSSSGTGADGSENQSATNSSYMSPLHDTASAVMSGAFGHGNENVNSVPYAPMLNVNPSDYLTVPTRTRTSGIILGANVPEQTFGMRQSHYTQTAPPFTQDAEQGRGLKRAFEKVRDLALSNSPSGKRAKRS
ncbi:uncharacterized protein LY89DRAFT_740880 [Mollisia scopiformis]|uniref:Uncharacterized protein n=1 Tax=Mollisia scopiformis TaxID=149040 RepID=A0A132BC19_MOLSC|nr:uncharacterized protein LY89DRAFT_740880 [Mollisia scopiformis]KUJ09813.1 hypothetical protein LY89DRAFT_740880 [Mollisia scopiformis]